MSWNDWILANEMAIRLGFFLGVFTLIALWEIVSPRRKLTLSKGNRWVSNISLAVLNTIILRLLFPAAAVGVAIITQQRGWGLFNNAFHGIELPGTIAVILAVVIMDLAIYLQHVMFHAIPLLWRLHRVHHADMDYDLTTGARFHTLEVILSMLIKFAVIILLGPAPIAVMIFEVLLSATSAFNHGNVYIPEKIDRILRLCIVTPDMHRVHHSVYTPQTNANFGFNLPWWDRLFGTYVAQPMHGHIAMQIGLQTHRNPAQVATLKGMLGMPFIRESGG